jgi:tripartite ATP-independent transporter DctM subunit
MEWYWVAVGLFGGLLLVLLAGVPVSFSLWGVSLIGLVWLGGGFSLLADLPGVLFHHLNSFVMTAVPLFVLMSMAAEEAGFARLMFDSVRAWFGKVPGSLAMVGVIGCTIFSAICGSSAGTAAAMGVLAIPEYKRAGCDKKLSVGSLAAGGALGILIPPSVPMIFYCVITEQSIGSMFAAGVLPGLLVVVLFLLYIYIRCWINPKLIPALPSVPLRERIRSSSGLIPILIIIILVLGTIYLGIATPTEAAALGAFGTVVMGLATRKLPFKGIFRVAIKAVNLNAFLLLIFMAAVAFGVVGNRAGVAEGFVNWVLSMGLSKWVILIVIQLILLFLGCFMDPSPIILTTTPLFFPVAQSLGFDPIWFGILMVINLEIGCITPPVGFNLFVLRGIGRDFVTMGDIIIGAAPFMGLYALALVLVAFFPQIALFLPNLIK